MLVTGTIPNMLGGMSQQPPSVRGPTQAEIQENTLASVTHGLMKRPPTSHIAQTTLSFSSPPFVHWINRDNGERYCLIIDSTGTARVYDLLGNSYYVRMAGAGVNTIAYMHVADPSKNLRAITVADTTILVNRTVVVDMLSTTTAAQQHQCVLWVRQGGYKITYKAKIVFNNNVPARTEADETYFCTTGDGTDASNASTTNVASLLSSQLVGGGSGGINPLPCTTLCSDFFVVKNANHIWLRVNTTPTSSNDFQVTVSDSMGNAGVKCIKDSVQLFSDLPATAPQDMVVNVAGDAASDKDDYWVKFQTTNGTPFDPGRWVECPKPGIKYRLNSDTLPVLLVRCQDNASGTITGTPYKVYFDLRSGTWADRLAGDDAPAMQPSFIGKTLSNVFLYHGRLGFLCDTNVVMSAAGDYFNFWRKTALTLLDSDPIDIQLSSTRVDKFNWATPYSGKLLLWCSCAQVQLQHGDILSPKTVGLSVVSEYSTDAQCRPVVMGNMVYFTATKGDYAAVNEYLADLDTMQFYSTDVTEHVPSLIYGPSGGVSRCLASSSPDNTLVVLSSGAGGQGSVYVYRCAWNGREKVVSAWCRWPVQSNLDAIADTAGVGVVSATFIDSNLYLLVCRAEGFAIEKVSLPLTQGQTDRQTTPSVSYFCLDRQVISSSLSTIYHSTSNTTTFALPYSPLLMTAVANDPSQSTYGSEIAVSSMVTTSPYQVTLVGRWDATPVVFGFKYTMLYRFSPFLVRQPSQSGSIAIVDGRLQVVKVSVAFKNSYNFHAQVSPLYRTTSTYQFSGTSLGIPASVVSTYQPVYAATLANKTSGVVSFYVNSKSDQVGIDLINDSVWPSTFVSAEWLGNLYTMSTRRV